MRIKLDFTQGVASKAATRISAVLRARAMENVFFVAFNVFAANADELHTAPRNGTDYYKEAHRRAQIKILCNSAMPNAPFQNMHWDFPNFQSAHLAIGAFYPSNACVYGLLTYLVVCVPEVPLINVKDRSGAPLQVWPRSHHALYNETFNSSLIRELFFTSKRRSPCHTAAGIQYFCCAPEIVAAGESHPSQLVVTTLGDAIVRNPSVWHRGTPNRLSFPRDQISFVFSPLVKDTSRWYHN